MKKPKVLVAKDQDGKCAVYNEWATLAKNSENKFVVVGLSGDYGEWDHVEIRELTGELIYEVSYKGNDKQF